jgi:quercetin dioxygenase-like cupin family protein
MSRFAFDDQNITWKRLNGIEHLWLSVLDFDEGNKIIHVLYKFAARQQIVLHRHKTLNKTFVVQGEHRLYHASGELKEVRAVGSYTVSLPSDDPHREGGGEQDVVVLFTIYGDEEVLYEVLDNDLNVIALLTAKDFLSLYDAER